MTDIISDPMVRQILKSRKYLKFLTLSTAVASPANGFFIKFRKGKNSYLPLTDAFLQYGPDKNEISRCSPGTIIPVKDTAGKRNEKTIRDY